MIASLDTKAQSCLQRNTSFNSVVGLIESVFDWKKLWMEENECFNVSPTFYSRENLRLYDYWSPVSTLFWEELRSRKGRTNRVPSGAHQGRWGGCICISEHLWSKMELPLILWLGKGVVVFSEIQNSFRRPLRFFLIELPLAFPTISASVFFWVYPMLWTNCITSPLLFLPSPPIPGMYEYFLLVPTWVWMPWGQTHIFHIFVSLIIPRCMKIAY